MSDTTQYAAIVEADSIITFTPPEDVAGDEEAIEEWLEDTVNTGHLGPANVRGLQEDPMDGEGSDDA